MRRREVGPLTVKELLCALRNLCRALNGRGRLEAAGPRTERTRLEAGFGYPGGVASRPFVMVRCARFVVALHFFNHTVGAVLARVKGATSKPQGHQFFPVV